MISRAQGVIWRDQIEKVDGPPQVLYSRITLKVLLLLSRWQEW